METPPRISLDQWRALLAVVDHGGYAQAAAALDKTQSSISYAIHKMENLLGLKVLEVRGRKAQLTRTGQMLVRRARNLVDEAGELEAAARHAAGGWETDVRLAVDQALPATSLLQTLKQFAAQAPQTRVHVLETTAQGCDHSLLHGHADLAVSAHVPIGLLGTPLLPIQLVAVAHPEHPLHHLPHPPGHHDLRAHRQLVLHDHSRHDDALERQQYWTLNHTHSLIEALRQGLGFAWLPRHAIEQQLAQGQLKALPLREGAERHITLNLIFSDPDTAGPATRELARLLRLSAAQHAESQDCEETQDMKRIGKRYRTGRADAHYDAIVIGSGIGGLCNAALLAKLGQKVAVFEQHYTAGGFTHSYEREGYEWDVGVHYVGEVHKPHSPLRRIFDVISEGRLEWAPMDDIYDRIIVNGRSYDFPAGRDNFVAAMKGYFPDEAAAIDAYVELVDSVARAARKLLAGQAMPPWLAKAYNITRGMQIPKQTLMKTRDVLESLTSNQELIAVLTGQWGDYGMVPAEATFFMHASVVKHYFGGGSYPVGGSWKIAEAIVPTIRAAGGEVFTYARVDGIHLENGSAAGARMDNGDIIRADKIISATGARITYEKLLPEETRSKLGVARKMQSVKPSSAHLCLYVGLKGSAEELDIPKTNLWIYPSADHEGNIERFLADPSQDFPLLYISFPSAKDPEWPHNYPGKSTVEVLTLGPYDWFEKWQDKTWNQRGEDYEAFKEQFSKRLLDELFKHMPQLKPALDYYELSTPLSTQWFQLNDRGEIYGLDHDPERFKQDWLHPVSPIKNLYLTGQDVVTAGVGGALIGGLMTTGAMLGPRKFQDVMKLLKTWQPETAN